MLHPERPSTDQTAGFRHGPDYTLEAGLAEKGYQLIAGADEAGRGPLAGPVVAAAVVLNPDDIPSGLNDSKKLTAKRREELFDEIAVASRAVCWHAANHATIDRINIRQASLRAMAMALGGLQTGCDHALIDGRDVPPGLSVPALAVIKGDGRSLSIAAASIVAKVMRDRMMLRADIKFPAFGFAGHKGYGSARHLAAIREQGPCPLHRHSFSPMKDA
ncbi:ribonuclease HII [Salaquimonas pukyongi]|uniref:ribonuclease HII n=1 Tax=Salaquimonas pukyongi TaxID=2712698 RepID=UPI00096B7992|nr:ribonuclease HII [Salaquimonas pukyongi]